MLNTKKLWGQDTTLTLSGLGVIEGRDKKK